MTTDPRTLIERLLDAAMAHHDPRVTALFREAAEALIRRVPAPHSPNDTLLANVDSAPAEPPAPAQRSWRRNEDGTYTSNTEQSCGTCTARGTIHGHHGIPLHLGWCQPDQLFKTEKGR